MVFSVCKSAITNCYVFGLNWLLWNWNIGLLRSLEVEICLFISFFIYYKHWTKIVTSMAFDKMKRIQGFLKHWKSLISSLIEISFNFRLFVSLMNPVPMKVRLRYSFFKKIFVNSYFELNIIEMKTYIKGLQWNGDYCLVCSIVSLVKNQGTKSSGIVGREPNLKIVWVFFGLCVLGFFKLLYNMDNLFKLHFRVKQPVIVFLMKVEALML